MMDIAIHEAGEGGDIRLVDNYDIETTDGLFNMPYLAHFGGNVEAVTTGDEEEGEQRSDWWGNAFLEKDAQMNSRGEKSLNENALNSNGRADIEEDFKEDLQFFSEIGDSETVASITGNDRIQISDTLTEPETTAANTYKFLWDATKQEMIQEINI